MLLGFLSFLRRFRGLIILGNIVSELVEPELSSLATLTASVLLLRPPRVERDCCCWLRGLFPSGASHLSLAMCSECPGGRWLRWSGAVLYFRRSCRFWMMRGAPCACIASLDTGVFLAFCGARPAMDMRGAPSHAFGCGTP